MARLSVFPPRGCIRRATRRESIREITWHDAMTQFLVSAFLVGAKQYACCPAAVVVVAEASQPFNGV